MQILQIATPWKKGGHVFFDFVLNAAALQWVVSPLPSPRHARNTQRRDERDGRQSAGEAGVSGPGVGAWPRVGWDPTPRPPSTAAAAPR